MKEKERKIDEIIHEGAKSGSHMQVVTHSCLVGLKALSRGGKSCAAIEV